MHGTGSSPFRFTKAHTTFEEKIQPEEFVDNFELRKSNISPTESILKKNNESTYYKNSKAFSLTKSFEHRKYSDKFREKNMNDIKHLFQDRKINLNGVIWESQLRDYRGKRG